MPPGATCRLARGGSGRLRDCSDIPRTALTFDRKVLYPGIHRFRLRVSLYNFDIEFDHFPGGLVHCDFILFKDSNGIRHQKFLPLWCEVAKPQMRSNFVNGCFSNLELVALRGGVTHIVFGLREQVIVAVVDPNGTFFGAFEFFRPERFEIDMSAL